MKSVGLVSLLLLVSLLYLDGVYTAADEGAVLLAFTKDLVDTMGYLRGNSNTSKRWNSANIGSHCGWYGVTCNNESSVTEINLGNCVLSGTLATGLANLKSLQKLYLFQNSITGNIPEEIGSLTELLLLDLSYNFLTGTLPITLSNLKKLETLDLSDNNIAGSIPENFGNDNLRYLDLSDNHLTGNLPNKLIMSNGGSIDLSNNSLSGSVPEYWVNSIIPAMTEVDLTFNNLSGLCTDAACGNEE